MTSQATKAIALLAATQLGCASIQDAFVNKIDEEMRMQQACAGFAAGPNEVPSTFLGGDDGSIARMKINLGVGVEAPLANLRELHAKLTKIPNISDCDVKETCKCENFEELYCNLIKDLNRAIDSMDKASSHWRAFSRSMETVADGIGDSGLSDAMSNCARHKLSKDPTVGSCSWNADIEAVLNLGESLRKEAEPLPKDMEAITASIRAIRNDLVQIRQLAGEAKLPPERIAEVEHMLTEMLAFGGVISDGYADALVLGSEGDSQRKIIAIAQLLVGLQSDRIVDVIILWIGKGVAKLEKQIDAIDDAAYGLVSTATSIASQTKAANAGLCRIADFIETQLALAGVDKAAFGARACHALTSGTEAYPNSQLMTAILRALLYASADSCEGSKRRDPETETDDVVVLPDEPVPADVPMFRDVGQDVESIADSLWDARKTLAAHQLRTVPIDELSVEHLPRRDEVPAMLLAPIWLTRQMHSAEIEALEDVGRRMDAFLRLQEELLRLQTPYSVVANVYVCSGSNLPAFCTGQAVDLDETNLAVREVAFQICQQNAAEARRDAATMLCAHAETTFEGTGKPNPCIATSRGAFFDVYERFGDMESFNYPPGKKTPSRSPDMLQLVAHVIATYPLPEGQTEIHIQGRASSTLPTHENARKLMVALGQECAEEEEEEKEMPACWPEYAKLESGYWATTKDSYCGAHDCDDARPLANHMLGHLRAVDALRMLRRMYPRVCEGLAKCSIDDAIIESERPGHEDFRAVTIEVILNDKSSDCEI